ncbi:hypothetical protein H2203_005541 [Taxawa tesnikishii (nom. ined.)]|nr:hypothetical protein H2203_005541 [Dothideales sp. JES 119]
MADSSLSTAVSSFLGSKSLPPSQTWLSGFLANPPSSPLPATLNTALFRIKASDITVSLQPTASMLLPPSAANVDLQEQKLRGPIPVQVLDIEDIGRSRWSQVEALEAQERGETTKGREVIRVVPGPEGENASEPQTNKSSGPHKLLLQDAKGTKIYGFELEAVKGVGISMAIGAKLVLKDATIARGVVLLDPASVEVLGGKIDAWDKAWREGRKEALKMRVGVQAEQG